MKKLLLNILLPSLCLAAPPPELARYEGQMTTFADKHCVEIADPNQTFDFKLLATYYDAQWAYYQIADYTKDSRWNECATRAEKVYRDQYLLANQGKLPGYWIFPHGLYEDFKRTGDAQSKEAVRLLVTNAAYAQVGGGEKDLVTPEFSREVAYNLMTQLLAKKLELTEASDARIATLRGYAFSHLREWFEDKTAAYVRPFMVSLTAHALIEAEEYRPDSRTLPALKRAADQMWETMWLPPAEAFKYTDRVVPSGGDHPSPDLNLLIAPLYVWLHRRTNDPRYIAQADAIFGGGVKQAYLLNGKQFNQNYRLMNYFFSWRGGTATPTPAPTPVVPKAGKGKLVGGKLSVTEKTVTSDSVVKVFRQTRFGNAGHLSVVKEPGEGFEVQSSTTNDRSEVYWELQ